jgi:hypothetical protein
MFGWLASLFRLMIWVVCVSVLLSVVALVWANFSGCPSFFRHLNARLRHLNARLRGAQPSPAQPSARNRAPIGAGSVRATQPRQPSANNHAQAPPSNRAAASAQQPFPLSGGSSGSPSHTNGSAPRGSSTANPGAGRAPARAPGDVGRVVDDDDDDDNDDSGGDDSLSWQLLRMLVRGSANAVGTVASGAAASADWLSDAITQTTPQLAPSRRAAVATLLRHAAGGSAILPSECMSPAWRGAITLACGLVAYHLDRHGPPSISELAEPASFSSFFGSSRTTTVPAPVDPPAVSAAVRSSGPSILYAGEDGGVWTRPSGGGPSLSGNADANSATRKLAADLEARYGCRQGALSSVGEQWLVAMDQKLAQKPAPSCAIALEPVTETDSSKLRAGITMLKASGGRVFFFETASLDEWCNGSDSPCLNPLTREPLAPADRVSLS